MRMVILANSVRRGQRCVAGKEVGRGLFWWKPGPWIRLIDPGTKGGEVRIENTYCEGGGHARVLDVVDVPVSGPAGHPDHPEDWFLLSDTPWTRIERMTRAELGALADSPEELWFDGDNPRAVPAGYVEGMPAPATLYLIGDAEECVTRWWSENREGEEKVRRRLYLKHHGRAHEFDITDPSFTRRHALFETAKQEKQSLALKTPLLLCLSLTRPWQGKQYKIAATIFEAHA
jgi:hypothetical protein